MGTIFITYWLLGSPYVLECVEWGTYWGTQKVG